MDVLSPTQTSPPFGVGGGGPEPPPGPGSSNGLDVLSVVQAWNPFGTSSPTAMAPKLRIRGAIVAALKADPGVSAVVGANVFPVHLPERQITPALVYRLTSNPRDHCLSGGSSRGRASFTFECLSKDCQDCEDLAEAVRQVFDGFSGTLSGVQIQETLLLDESDDYYDPDDGSDYGTYQYALDYIFLYREPSPV